MARQASMAYLRVTQNWRYCMINVFSSEQVDSPNMCQDLLSSIVKPVLRQPSTRIEGNGKSAPRQAFA